LGLHPLAAVGKIVRKQKINSYVHGEETVHKTEHTKWKAKRTKQKTNIKGTTKKHKRIN
jgi:hypothetical protein